MLCPAQRKALWSCLAPGTPAQGTAQNLTAAREFFERGAALNNSDSLYNLATLHFHGAGTPVNHSLGEGEGEGL